MKLHLNLNNGGPWMWRDLVMGANSMKHIGNLIGCNATYTDDDSHTYLGSDITFGPRGFPTALIGGQQAIVGICDSNNDYHMKGGLTNHYLLQTTGSGMIEFLQFNGYFIGPITATGGTQSYPLTFPNDAGKSTFSNINLRLSNVPASDPLTDIRLYRPDPNTGTYYDPADTSSLYTREYLSVNGGYDGYRTMDLLGTIVNFDVNFTDRESSTDPNLRPTSSIGYGDVLPYAVVADLMTRIGSSVEIHLNVPLLFSDAAVATLATLFRDHTGNIVGVELGNEIWNYGSPQCKKAYAQAMLQFGLPAEPDDADLQRGAIQWGLYRSKQVHDIFATVFAATGQIARLRPLLSVLQTQSQSVVDENYFPTVAANPYGIPYNASTSIKPILMTNGYWGSLVQLPSILGGVLAGGLDTLVAQLGVPSCQYDIAPEWTRVANMAAAYATTWRVYEGAFQSQIDDPGTTVDPQRTEFLSLVVQFQADARIQGLITQYYQWAKGTGCEAFAHYDGEVAFGLRGSIFGSWSNLSFFDQDPTPMYLANRAYLASPSSYPGVALPPPPAAPIAFNASPATLSSGQSFSLTLTIAMPQSSDTVFNLTVSDPSDYFTFSPTLTIAAGETSGMVTGSVQPHFEATATSTISAQHSYSTITTTINLVAYTPPYVPDPSDSRSDSHLLMICPFYESTGSTIHDVSGHNDHLNVATIPGDLTTRVPGPNSSGPGAYAYVPGSGGAGLSAVLQSSLPKSSLSLGLIYQDPSNDPSSNGSQAALLTLWNPALSYEEGTLDYIEVFSTSSGPSATPQLQVLMRDPAGDVGGVSAPLTRGAYHLIVVTIGGGNLDLYVDGSLAATAPIINPPTGSFSRITLARCLVSAAASTASEFAGLAVSTRVWSSMEAAMPLGQMVKVSTPAPPPSVRFRAYRVLRKLFRKR